MLSDSSYCLRSIKWSLSLHFSLLIHRLEGVVNGQSVPSPMMSSSQLNARNHNHRYEVLVAVNKLYTLIDEEVGRIHSPPVTIGFLMYMCTHDTPVE